MFGSQIVVKRGSRDEAEKPFWISFADLMTALMVLFLVVMGVALLAVTKNVTEKEKREEQHRKDIELILDRFQAASKRYNGIKIDRDRHVIDFGDRARFAFGKSNLAPEQEAVLRQFVPEILTLANDELGKRILKRVVVEGYTDRTGTYLSNLDLSLQRSERVLCSMFANSLAAQCETLERLLQGDVSNDFQAYLDALEHFSVGRLAAQSLPGTNQQLKWRHLLAWCIRDQRTRFDGFYHWRAGEGLGFTRPRRDPPLFVGSVLGLVDAELDQLFREIESKQIQFEQGKERIPELERTPAFALAHADRQLRIRLGAGEDEPLYAATVGQSIESRVLAAVEIARQKDERWESEVEQAEEQLAQEQIRLTNLNHTMRLAEAEGGIAKALVDTNRADFERLTKVRDRLEGLDGGRCDHGNIEFSACEYIQDRKGAVSLTWHRDGKEVQANAQEFARQLARREAEFRGASTAVFEQSQRISEKKAELRRLRVRIATNESTNTLLKKSWDELQALHSQRAQGIDTFDLIQARQRQKELESELNRLRTSTADRRSQRSARVDAIKSLTARISSRLLGAEGHARFVPDDEVRPFGVLRGGEAYQVLEVLLGDIVCLLDSATSEASSHPGFLVHDCPREADMSERLYREFFLVASEAAAQLGEDGTVPFQFIVTTTSPPPEEVHGDRYIVLKLEPGAEEKLLFKR